MNTTKLANRVLFVSIALLVFVLTGSLVANNFLWKSYRWAGEQSAERIEREHGVSLPASAASFQCKGDAWKRFLDRGASSIFVMPKSDLQAFRAQLSPNPNLRTFIPGNTIYQGFVKPWTSASSPLETLSCDSPTGDWLHVEVWEVDDNHVGIWLYTDWN